MAHALAQLDERGIFAEVVEEVFPHLDELGGGDEFFLQIGEFAEIHGRDPVVGERVTLPRARHRGAHATAPVADPLPPAPSSRRCETPAAPWRHPALWALP